MAGEGSACLSSWLHGFFAPMHTTKLISAAAVWLERAQRRACHTEQARTGAGPQRISWEYICSPHAPTAEHVPFSVGRAQTPPGGRGMKLHVLQAQCPHEAV
jgi:hypothetical protein